MLTDVHHIEEQELPLPQTGPHDVLIRTAVAGICGSDLHVFRGHHPFRKPPVVLGHEISGVVEAVGPAVTQFSPGDRVTVEPQITCGKCYYCKKGLTNLCTEKQVPGTGGWVGTFAEYFVAPEAVVYRVPDSVPLSLAALTEPLAVAVRAVRRAGLTGGETVAVTGSGTIGALTMVCCRLAGAGRMMATDILPYNLEHALRIGADRAVNARTDSVVAEGLRFTGDVGFDVAFVTVDSAESVKEGCRLARKQGRVVVLSMYDRDIPLDAYAVVSREQEVVGSLTYTRSDFEHALRLLEQRPFPWETLITGQISLQQLQTEMKSIADRTRMTIKTQVVFGS